LFAYDRGIRAEEEAHVSVRTTPWLHFCLTIVVALTIALNAAAQTAPPPTTSAVNDPQAVRFAVAHQHTTSWCFGYLYVSPTAISYAESTPAKDQSHSFSFQSSQITSIGPWTYNQQTLKAARIRIGSTNYHFWWMPNEQVVQTGRPYEWNPPDAADPQQLIDIIRKSLPAESQVGVTSSGAATQATAAQSAQDPLVATAVGALDGNGNQVPPGSIGARIGTSLGNLSLAKSKVLGLSATTGALVEQLEPNGAAQKAGVRINDVITSLNGAPIAKAVDVRTALRHLAPGSTAELHLLRQGQPIKITVKVK
jgi:hypothetical protein